ncbi:hypothetical protein Y032_0040g247 [Ancylostoma ceylanicum]|uniref:Uncharacterized protein n=1 Tax=Ancylostoma ceylanicum TaxID=53326 RepID=A0A016UH86_9BILA|nr:hypothetical protein Y032_0040g247 [Ancylostoma ceylanicum]
MLNIFEPQPWSSQQYIRLTLQFSRLFTYNQFQFQVVCDDWKLVMVDDFAEISFSRNQQCEEVMQSVVKIRKQLNEGLQRKLRGLMYNPRELSESINRFAYVLAEGDVEISYVSHVFFNLCTILIIVFSMKRIVHPPRTLENVGFFLPNGEVEIDNEDYEIENTEVDYSDSGGQERVVEDVSKSFDM